PADQGHGHVSHRGWHIHRRGRLRCDFVIQCRRIGDRPPRGERPPPGGPITGSAARRVSRKFSAAGGGSPYRPRSVPCTLRRGVVWRNTDPRSEEHTSELQSRVDLVCRLLLEKKK